MACSLFGIGNDVAMKAVGVGFMLGVLNDSVETMINSSGDVLFAASAEFRALKKNGELLPGFMYSKRERKKLGITKDYLPGQEDELLAEEVKDIEVSDWKIMKRNAVWRSFFYFLVLLLSLENSIHIIYAEKQNNPKIFLGFTWYIITEKCENIHRVSMVIFCKP